MSLYRLNHLVDAGVAKQWICNDCRGMSADKVLDACERADWWLRLVRTGDVDSGALFDILALPGVEDIVAPSVYQACYISATFSESWHTAPKECWAYLEGLVDAIIETCADSYAQDQTVVCERSRANQKLPADVCRAALRFVDDAPAIARMPTLHAKLLEVLRRHYHPINLLGSTSKLARTGAEGSLLTKALMDATASATKYKDLSSYAAWLNDAGVRIRPVDRSFSDYKPQLTDSKNFNGYGLVDMKTGFMLTPPWPVILIDRDYVLISIAAVVVRVNFDSIDSKWQIDAVSSMAISDTLLN